MMFVFGLLGCLLGMGVYCFGVQCWWFCFGVTSFVWLFCDVVCVCFHYICTGLWN
jgi:hypothetical protein